MRKIDPGYLTGRKLLNYLQTLSDKELALPFACIGHYGEACFVDADAEDFVVRTAKESWTSSKHQMVIYFPHIDIGPEPD